MTGRIRSIFWILTATSWNYILETCRAGFAAFHVNLVERAAGPGKAALALIGTGPFFL